MITIYNYEGETEEKCRINCLDDLDVYDNEIITKEYQEDDLYKMDVIKIADIKQYIIDYLSNVFNLMNIKVEINVEEDEKIFNVSLKSKDSAIIIGKGGKNLSSLQFLIRQTLRNETNYNIKVNLDVSNYRLKKEQLFEKDIKRIINEVLKTKTDTKLDYMNSYNRRIVHNISSNYYNIETESFGEEPQRYVVIKYVEK